MKDIQRLSTLGRKYNLKETLQNEIIQIAKKNNVEKVILFGSRARGDNGDTSDIDLAVYSGNYSSFAVDLEECNTLLKFDVVNLQSVCNQELKEEIEREGITIYEKV